MRLRIVTGLAAGLVLLALILWGTPSLMLSVVIACSALAYLEFDRLFFEAPSGARQIRMVALIAFTLIAIRENQTLGWFSLWFSFVLLAFWKVGDSGRSGDFANGIRELAFELFGLLYILSLFAFLVPIAEAGPFGREYLILLMLMVFVGDSAAYFVGKRFGVRKMAPLLSPNKTLEGGLAAVAGSFLVAVAWAYGIRKDLPPDVISKVILFSPVASVLAQLGDLFESMMKRSQAKKDSGVFLPGHGGILDRVDGLALVTPVFYVYLNFVLGRA